MIAYHFTGTPFLNAIRAQGLTKGALPWNLDREGRPEMRPGFQWLTLDPEWFQLWAAKGQLPYARNSYRITLEIPPEKERRAFRWTELVRRCNPDCAEEIQRNAGDVSKWIVYAGVIPPQWFLAIERNPYPAIIIPRNDIIT